MYPASLLAPKPCTPVPPASFADTAFTFIDTRAGLLALVETLEQQATHLAVDLEHHSTRTFAGFLCLAQMTARNGAGEVLGDWVIDLVVPEVRGAMRDHMGRVLANPAIIKVSRPPLRPASRPPPPLTSGSFGRSSTAPKATSYGCSRTLISLLSTCSTPTTRRRSSVGALWDRGRRSESEPHRLTGLRFASNRVPVALACLAARALLRLPRRQALPAGRLADPADAAGHARLCAVRHSLSPLHL